MMLMSETSNAVHGELIGSDARFTAVSKDTRELVQGSLYVALKGERFDGHGFVEQALAAGAAGVLVSEQQMTASPQIVVDDTRLALGRLAAYWRQQYRGRIVGITGSNGKTTVKEMTRSILEQAAGGDRVLSTQGNLNNDIGMPMTLLGLRQQHEYAVIEMGANHPGEIDYLTHIARPHVAVVNNAGPAHLEGFGSLDNVASSKAEIYTGIVDGGTAVVNADDAYADYWKDICSKLGNGRKLLTFSMQDESADIYANVTGANGDQRMQLKTPTGEAVVELAVPGIHNVMNALAATAVASALDIALEDIVEGLSGFGGVSGRLSTLYTPCGARIINDTYNANPFSLKAAMNVLVAREADTWLILGDMAELGDEEEVLHRRAGEQARALGVKHLLATGKLARFAVEAFGQGGHFFTDRSQLIDTLAESITEDSVVLVKGSRSMAMEQIVNALLDQRNEQRVN
jgi:UDP-N-acetylmuramoyl-tripeptide--D-alanyl-D-alanine ligase